MERTTISIPPELLERFRAMASERRMSIAALVREALEEKANAYQPTIQGLGLFASGYTDTARRSSDERPVPRSWRSEPGGFQTGDPGKQAVRRIAEE